jgi:hypothetical protein
MHVIVGRSLIALLALSAHAAQGAPPSAAPTAAPLSLRPFVVAPVNPGENALRLTIDPAVVAALSGQDGAVEMLLPQPDGREVLAIMSRRHVLAPGAAVEIVGSDGVSRPAIPTISTWEGEVAGEDDSSVFLGITADQAHGWISTSGGVALLTTTGGAGQNRTTFVYDAALAGRDATLCAGAIDVPGVSVPPPTAAGPALRTGQSCRVFDLALEGDLEFTQNQPSPIAAVDYAVLLVAASSSIFSREADVGLRLSYLRLWNREDPWNMPTAGEQLGQFRDYWLANLNGISRGSAHLLSGRGLGGGVAYLRTLCDDNWSFGVSANLAGHFPLPVEHHHPGNWDLHVFTHELGHILGSGHTHNICEYDPIIDACGLNPNPDAGCEHGTQDCGAAVSGAGTIMSYCHICAGGEQNLLMSLGTRVAQRINEFALSRPCGVELPGLMFGGISMAPSGPICDQTAVTLTAVATGPDLRFQWFRDGLRLAGANSPTLTIAHPEDGVRYDVVVSSPCGLARTLGSPAGVTLDVGPCCMADFDGNSQVDVPDIFAFLSAWFSLEPAADLDGVPGVTVPDIFAFLAAWFAGC